MAIELDRNHKWNVFEDFGRLPENLGADFKAPSKPWVAVIVDKTTGRAVAKSEPSATRTEAVADAERKYAARRP